jgi:hypothetical protein
MFESNAAKDQMKKSGISQSRLGHSIRTGGDIEVHDAEMFISDETGHEGNIEDHGRAVRSGAGGGADVDSTVSGLVLQNHIFTILGFMGNNLGPVRLAAVELVGQFQFLFVCFRVMGS